MLSLLNEGKWYVAFFSFPTRIGGEIGRPDTFLILKVCPPPIQVSNLITSICKICSPTASHRFLPSVFLFSQLNKFFAAVSHYHNSFLLSMALLTASRGTSRDPFMLLGWRIMKAALVLVTTHQIPMALATGTAVDPRASVNPPSMGCHFSMHWQRLMQ